MVDLVWPNGSIYIPAVSGNYGMRWHPITGVWKMHDGIDLVGWSTICSPVAGEVIYAGYNGGFGNLIKVRASNGDEFWMAHNRSFLVGRGAWVAKGQAIAIMGTTGASTGVHCHLEVHPGGGKSVDPRTYYANNNPASGGGTGDDMGAAEMAKLNNIEAILIATGPSLTDPNFIGGPGSIYNRLRNIEARLYAGGPSAADPKYTGAPGTIYALLKAGVQRTGSDGVTRSIPQIQELADAKSEGLKANEKLDKLIARPGITLTPEQLKALAVTIQEALDGDIASKADVEAAIAAGLSKLILVAKA